MAANAFYLVPDMSLAQEQTVKESNSTFVCPPNFALVGRMHKGDENGDTTYQYAPLVVDPNAEETRTINISDTSGWIDAGKESALNYQAPAGYVITGRKHDGDENGTTYFQISRVYVGNTFSETVDGVTSGQIKESSGIWYNTPAIATMKGLITGMSHSGDENGNSTYTSNLVYFGG
jgi:hypothetical protein